MFIRRVNGRAYLAESVRVGGQVIQQHLGPADADGILLVKLLAKKRDAERQEDRERRVEERERDRRLAEHWTTVRQEFETTMRAAGYHNPNGRGWKKRRVPRSDQAKSEGATCND